jgi:hypothetical protein
VQRHEPREDDRGIKLSVSRHATACEDPNSDDQRQEKQSHQRRAFDAVMLPARRSAVRLSERADIAATCDADACSLPGG